MLQLDTDTGLAIGQVSFLFALGRMAVAVVITLNPLRWFWLYVDEEVEELGITVHRFLCFSVIFGVPGLGD